MFRSIFKKPRRLLYTFLLITFAIILCPKPSIYAADVTLAWTANTESDLAGYYIYYKSGTSGSPYNGTGVDEGDSPIKVSLAEFDDPAHPEYTLHGLSDTETSYLVVTAYDTQDNESTFSNEVSYRPSTAPTPAITTPAPGSTLGGSTVTFSWSVSGVSVSEWWLYVGTSSGGNNIHDSGSLGTDISTTVSGLPEDGSTVYARLWYLTGGSWESVDAQYTAFGGGGRSFSSLSISGNDFVSENNSAGYVATAKFSDDTTQIVTGNAIWSENSMIATINSSGVLTASEVTEDTSVTIQASYSIGGVTKTTTKVLTIIDVPSSNLPPDTPNIAYPENYSSDVEVPLDITAAAFSDPNDDAHSQSQWQISEQSDFSTRVVDITSDNYLTTFPVPHMVLKSNCKYYVRVRFFDVYSTASNWSGSDEFTTAYFVVDLNGNGISDADEVDDTVDFNLDGIPDNHQPQIIKCVQASDGSVTIGIEKISSSAEEIESLEVIDPYTISDTVNRPADFIFGLFGYRLRVHTPGDTATIRIYFSGDIFASDVLYKYDTINGWYDYSEHTTFNDDGQSITLEVKDGGYGDSDGLANGIIVDPGGIASGGSSYSYSSLGSNIVGCFIATAAFGSKFEKHVQLLRRFRDLYLMPNSIGRAFVKAYYRHSPTMADFIARHDILRTVVRWGLSPLIAVSWMLLHFGAAPTILLLGLMISVLFIGYRKILHEN